MVGKHACYRVLLAALILASLLLLASFSIVVAQGLEEEQTFTLEEETLVEINEVGDAHITDTLTYDPAWFDEYSYIFEENPNLLSRRYRSDSNVGEVENFDVDIDTSESTITVSFDTPGYAYNMGETWDIYGYGSYESYGEDEDQVELGASWILTNEFTLFESFPLEETVIIDLPQGASDTSFDKGTGTIKYKLPYMAKSQGILAGNKTVFTIVFALVMALSLFLFLFAITRKPAPAVAATAPSVIPGPAMGTTPPPSDTSAVEKAGEAEVSREVQTEIPAGPKFCKRCGKPRSSPESKFCKNCGAPFE